MDNVKLLENLNNQKTKFYDEIGKVIVGQNDVIEHIFIALLCKGHILLEGVPGLGKTLIIKTISDVLDLNFNRIQFTPDLMPSDITGTEIINQNLDTGNRELKFIKGPIFSNIVLADEINRTPPKTQAALLQAMQEQQVTVGGNTYELDQPFLVFATQNPIEHEGTYPLPEAQLDRFMFIINVAYPTLNQEVEIATTTTSGVRPEMDMVLNAKQVQEFQQLVPSVPISKYIAEYAVRLTQSSRPNKNGTTPDFINEWVEWGAGPRASQYLLMGAKARALMDNRVAATIEDVKHVSRQVLEHRIILNFKAEAESITTNDIIEKLLDSIKP